MAKPSGSDDVVSLPSTPPWSEKSESLPEVLSSQEDPELPDPDSQQCCKMGCLTAMEENPLLRSRRAELDAGLLARREDKSGHIQTQYDCMRMWQTAKSGWRRFTVWGVPCCNTAMCAILHMSHHMCAKLSKHLTEGYMEPPQDLRKSQLQPLDRSDAVISAGVLLQWVYDHMAEFLPESDTLLAEKKSLAHVPGNQVLGQHRNQPVKWLGPNTTVTEMLDFASTFNPSTLKPSFPTFLRVYHREWERILKVRSEGQHSKCQDCGRLKEFRRLASSRDDINRCNKEYSAHIKSMLEDRNLDAKINARAKECAKGKLMEQSVISMTVDGMDSGKFRLPRNLRGSKEFSKMWRPEIHFHGMLVDGIKEIYTLTNCNIGKDSNLDLTLVSYG